MSQAKGLRQYAVLGSILIGAFSLVLTNSAFNVLLPYFVTYYGISTLTGGWIIALYMLAMTLTMPLASLVVDRLGRKRTYMLGIVLYGVSSVLGALLYEHVSVLLVVRFIHGAAAGLMIPLSLVLLFDNYGTEIRGRITGAWGMLLMIAPAIGPTLGGLIIQFGRLDILFWLNVPFAIGALFWCGRYIRPYVPTGRKHIQFSSISLMLGGIASLSLGIQLYSSTIVPTLCSWLLFGLGLLLLIGFVRLENGRQEPMIRYSLLKSSPIFAWSVLISTIQDCVMFGAIFALPLLFQNVFGLSPSVSGLMFLPGAIATSLFMWIGGNWFDRGQSKRFIAWGTLIVVLALFSFVLLPQSIGMIVLIVLMACRGAGMGLSGMSVSALGLQALPEEDMHEGSALATTLQRLISSFALIILTLFYDGRWHMLAQSGYTSQAAQWMALREVFVLLGTVLLLTLPVILSITRKKVGIIAEHNRLEDGEQPTA
ncbi:MFS transporter [Paenibacillus campi]|uniref:MFS transporter n=1 Tax=Paenibacillus campi TaxID=3106031 RepID=UPI002AFE7E71|nr:MFS transporter [Paenibacillus sp. SGZ-1014]